MNSENEWHTIHQKDYNKYISLFFFLYLKILYSNRSYFLIQSSNLYIKKGLLGNWNETKSWILEGEREREREPTNLAGYNIEG